MLTRSLEWRGSSFTDLHSMLRERDHRGKIKQEAHARRPTRRLARDRAPAPRRACACSSSHHSNWPCCHRHRRVHPLHRRRRQIVNRPTLPSTRRRPSQHQVTPAATTCACVRPASLPWKRGCSHGRAAARVEIHRWSRSPLQQRCDSSACKAALSFSSRLAAAAAAAHLALVLRICMRTIASTP